jgi:quercetin dioxygenase-like cupin family protein
MAYLTRHDGAPQPSPGYAGITREIAFETGGAILARVHAEPGTGPDWHHHGDREVDGHLLRGRMRFEFGPGAFVGNGPLVVDLVRPEAE